MARLCQQLFALAAVAAVAATAVALPATGNDRAEARVRGTCSGASSSSLRLRAEDGWIRIDAEIRPARSGARWTMIILHERQTVARLTLRASGGGGIQVRRTIHDWFGSDRIVVRATAAYGESCRASATLTS
jgi:hypothetical protein